MRVKTPTTRVKRQPCYVVTRALNTDHRLAPTTVVSVFRDGARSVTPRAPRAHVQPQLTKRDVIHNLIMSLPPSNGGNPDA